MLIHNEEQGKDFIVCNITKVILDDGVALLTGYITIKDGQMIKHFSNDPNNEISQNPQHPDFKVGMLTNRKEFEQTEVSPAPEGAPDGHYVSEEMLMRGIELKEKLANEQQSETPEENPVPQEETQPEQVEPEAPNEPEVPVENPEPEVEPEVEAVDAPAGDEAEEIKEAVEEALDDLPVENIEVTLEQVETPADEVLEPQAESVDDLPVGEPKMEAPTDENALTAEEYKQKQIIERVLGRELSLNEFMQLSQKVDNNE